MKKSEIKLNNLAVMFWEEEKYYGLNIINSLLKHNIIPKAILIEKKQRKFGIIKKIREFIRIYKKKGLVGSFNTFSRRILDLFIALKIIDSWESYKTYKLASKQLKHFEFGLKLSDFNFNKHGVELIYCDNNSQESIDYINKNNINIIIGSPRIISKKTLKESKGMFVNAHPAYLPYCRGKNPEIWTLYYGLNPGATLHFIDKGIDTGKIIDRVSFPFEEYDTWRTVRLKGKDHCISLYLKHILNLCSGKIKLKNLENQDLSIGKRTFGPTLKEYFIAKKNLRNLKKLIHLRKSIYFSYPGLFSIEKDKECIKKKNEKKA